MRYSESLPGEGGVYLCNSRRSDERFPEDVSQSGIDIPAGGAGRGVPDPVLFGGLVGQYRHFTGRIHQVCGAGGIAGRHSDRYPVAQALAGTGISHEPDVAGGDLSVLFGRSVRILHGCAGVQFLAGLVCGFLHGVAHAG